MKHMSSFYQWLKSNLFQHKNTPKYKIDIRVYFSLNKNYTC